MQAVQQIILIQIKLLVKLVVILVQNLPQVQVVGNVENHHLVQQIQNSYQNALLTKQDLTATTHKLLPNLVVIIVTYVDIHVIIMPATTMMKQLV